MPPLGLVLPPFCLFHYMCVHWVALCVCCALCHFICTDRLLKAAAEFPVASGSKTPPSQVILSLYYLTMCNVTLKVSVLRVHHCVPLCVCALVSTGFVVPLSVHFHSVHPVAYTYDISCELAS